MVAKLNRLFEIFLMKRPFFIWRDPHKPQDVSVLVSFAYPLDRFPLFEDKSRALQMCQFFFGKKLTHLRWRSNDTIDCARQTTQVSRPTSEVIANAIRCSLFANHPSDLKSTEVPHLPQKKMPCRQIDRFPPQQKGASSRSPFCIT
jgi:hypothetical protein